MRTTPVRSRVRASRILPLAVAISSVGLLALGSPAGAAPVIATFTTPGVVAGGFTVPTGVCFVTITADGGPGGTGEGGAAGGVGAEATGRVPVTPGSVLTVVVAGAGAAATV